MKILMLFLLGMVAAGTHADEHPDVQIGGTLLIDRPPYYWQRACDAQPHGLAPHLLKLVFHELNLSYHYQRPQYPQAIDWPALVTALEQRQIDLIASYPTPWASQSLIYGKVPLWEQHWALFARAEIADPLWERINREQSLEGVTLWVVQELNGSSSMNGPYLQQLQQRGATIRLSTDSGLPLLEQALQSGLVAVLEDRYIANYYLRQRTLALVERPLEHTQALYLTMHQDSPKLEWLARLDQQLARFNQPDYQTLLRERFMREWLQRQPCPDERP